MRQVSQYSLRREVKNWRLRFERKGLKLITGMNGKSKMENEKTYIIFCRIAALGKRKIKASNIEEAFKIAETDGSTNFEEIVRLMRPSKVDKNLSHELISDIEHPESAEYKSWGSE